MNLFARDKTGLPILIGFGIAGLLNSCGHNLSDSKPKIPISVEVDLSVDMSDSSRNWDAHNFVVDATCQAMQRELRSKYSIRITDFADELQVTTTSNIATRLDALRVCKNFERTAFQFGQKFGTPLYKRFETANYRVRSLPNKHLLSITIVHYSEGDNFQKTVTAINRLLDAEAVVLILVGDPALQNTLEAAISHPHFKVCPAADNPAAAVAWGFKEVQGL